MPRPLASPLLEPAPQVLQGEGVEGQHALGREARQDPGDVPVDGDRPAALRVYRRPKPVDSRAIEVPA